MKFKLTITISLFISFSAIAQDSSAIHRKIPIDGNRWYQLTNAAYGLQALTDGDTINNVFTGWGKIINYYDSYYPVIDGEFITIDSIRMFDRTGPIAVPTTLFAIDSNWNRIRIATYSGGFYNQWIGPYPGRPTTFKLDTAIKNIKYLMLTNGDDYPVELELYGYYKSPNPIPALNKRSVKLGNVFGVNGYEWNFENPLTDPTVIDSALLKPIKTFTGFRHYMDWQKLEATQNSYTYDPTRSGGWNYDTIYAACKSNGITVLADLKTQPLWMQNTWPSNLVNEENVPVVYGKNFADPNSYLEQAKVAFQYTARYGSNAQINQSLLSVNSTPRWTNDKINTIRVGLNTIKYIECDNERDKWWKGRNAYQTGREYAANLSAFYDGNKNTMGAAVGVKNADTSMKVVMCGVADPSTDYFRGIVDWCKEFRGYKTDGKINLCFDIINYHYYSKDINNTTGTAPELSKTDSIAKAFINMAHQYAYDMPVWVTESGYDLNQNSTLRAIPIGNKTPQITQADWLLRTSLLYARCGVERVFFYQLYDNDTSSNNYSTCGLLNDNAARRPAADYIYQTNKMFGNYFYQQTLNADPVVDQYSDSTSVMYVVYVPDQVGRTANYTLQLSGADSAFVYTPTPGTDTMSLKKYKIINGSITLTATETPVFVTTKNAASVSNSNNHYKLYPNPSNHFVMIDSLYNNSSISLINSSGQLIKTEKNSNTPYKMNLPNIVAGMYYIRIDDQSGTHYLPFVKTNQ